MLDRLNYDARNASGRASRKAARMICRGERTKITRRSWRANETDVSCVFARLLRFLPRWTASAANASSVSRESFIGSQRSSTVTGEILCY